MKLTIYRGNEQKTIPAIDFGEAYLKQGWTLEPAPTPLPKSEPTPLQVEETKSATVADLPALALLNSATKASELEELPTIGKALARVVFERRPVGGYTSLEHAEEINLDKVLIDWEAIALWTNE